MANENADQKVFWERFAEHWVSQQADLDGLMAPVLDGVFARANLRPGQRVLDVGCGTGTSTLRALQAVAPDGHVTGADISEPMLSQARKASDGLANVEFITADAAHHAFDAATYDTVISRFGVMFFANPQIAFANIRKAMKPGARIHMACWSNLRANPWFEVPMYAAKNQLGAPPKVDPDAPGPLAFRDIDRVTGILKSAGFDDITGAAEQLHLTPPGDLQNVAHHATSIGPASRTMQHFEATEADFDTITHAVAAAFEGHMTANGARIPAEINFYSATAP